MSTRVIALLLAATAALATPLGAQERAPDVPAVAPALARLVPPIPTPAGYIADVPDLIPPAAQAALDARITALQAAGRGDVGVAIVPSVGDYAPAEVGVAIYRTWRIGRIDTIGSARRNLGVLLLLVPKELAPDGRGHCWITTGRGAEGIVTDAASARICRERVVPSMRERDYAAAVGAGIDGIEARLLADEGLSDASSPAEPPGSAGRSRPLGGFPWWAGLLTLVGGVATGIFGALRWRRLRPRACSVCGRPMRRLSETDDDAALVAGQRLEERLRSVDYDVWRCDQGHETVLRYRRHFSSLTECPSCHFRTVKTSRRTARAATYAHTGLAIDTHTCQQCGHEWAEDVILPVLQRSTSSPGGGGGGGGGGGSFGGSGSTGGGGGGSSY